MGTTAFVNTYGVEFRHTILRNRAMFSLMMFWLLWAPMGPQRLNCVFRVNCDTPASLRSGGLDKDNLLVMNGNETVDPGLINFFWSGLAFWSAGGLGKCFMGPQIKTWQADWFTWLEATTGLKSGLNNTGGPRGCDCPASSGN